MVILDTSVWSEFFRRKKVNEARKSRVIDLIREGRVVLLGVVKQELLSGISDAGRFELLLDALSGFAPLLARDADHIVAARFFNICRKNGIQGSFVDFLICAQAVNMNYPIFTTDHDFLHYQKILQIRIWHAGL